MPVRRRRTTPVLVLTALVAALLAMVSPAQPAGAGVIQEGFTFYGALATTATTSDLYLIDSVTGAADPIGPIGYAVTGLAIDPTTGVLYGSTSNNSANSPGSLITIDSSTGAGTFVGSYGIDGHTAADITFGPDGTLYGLFEPSFDDLATIDKTTGAATVIGDAGFGSYGSGIDYDPDAGTVLWAASGDSGSFRSINTTTGASTELFTLSGDTGRSIAAMTTGCDGDLWAVRLETSGARPAELVTIDRSDGTLDVVAPTINQLDALAADCASFDVEVAPAYDRAVPTFDWNVVDDVCISGTSGTVLDTNSEPVDGATVTVDTPNSGTVTFADDVPASFYLLSITCLTADGTVEGFGFMAFARGTVNKAVEGTAPAGAAYTIAVACDDDGGGAYTDDFDFPATGGSASFVIYEGVICDVEETDDGGATSSSQSADVLDFLEEPSDESVTVTNVFGARSTAPPAARPVTATPTFTG